jgi:hypothetical protein
MLASGSTLVMGLMRRRAMVNRCRPSVVLSATSTTTVAATVAFIVVISRQGPKQKGRRSGEQKDVAFHPNLERVANGLAWNLGSIIAPRLRPCHPRTALDRGRQNNGLFHSTHESG